MKRLLGAVAVAALLGAAPAWAQTSSSDQTSQPVPQANSADKTNAETGATTTSDAGSNTGKTRHHARSGRSQGDNTAEQLNRQELDRVQGSGAAGTTTGGAGMGGRGASGSSVPSSGSPKGY
jgi:hypothetical protein